MIRSGTPTIFAVARMCASSVRPPRRKRLLSRPIRELKPAARIQISNRRMLSGDIDLNGLRLVSTKNIRAEIFLKNSLATTIYSAIVSVTAQPVGLWPGASGEQFFDCFIELSCFSERAKSFRIGKGQQTKPESTSKLSHDR